MLWLFYNFGIVYYIYIIDFVETSLLIYCYHGHTSQHLAEFFSDFGFKDVYSLEGGYEAWKESNQ